jgi:hypothetical protein
MKRILFSLLVAATALTAVPTAEAKRRDHGDRYDRYDRYDRRDRHNWRHHDRTRTIYVIENRRPVRRVVYVDDSGSYYRVVSGRRSYIRSRYYTSYPSRYYYADGRPRVGVSINF